MKPSKKIIEGFAISLLFACIVGLSFSAFYSEFSSLNSEKYFLEFFNDGNRLGHIKDAVCGNQTTGLTLMRCIQIKNGDQISEIQLPMETAGDDLGVYWLSPIIANAFNITSPVRIYLYLFIPIVLLINCFFNLGIVLNLSQKSKKIPAYFLVAIFSFFLLYVLDVYIVGILPISMLGVLYYTYTLPHKKGFWIMLMLICLTAGYSNIFRSHSGTGLMVLILLFLLLNAQGKFKIKAIILAIALFILPMFHLKLTMIKRNEKYLSQGYNPNNLNGFQSSHIFWHTLYLGLGYLPNEYGIQWNDNYGYAKAKEFVKNNAHYSYKNFNPVVMPKEYEDIMKKLYLNVWEDNWFFVVKTHVLKFLMALLLVLPFLGFGIFALFKLKPSYTLWIPFVLSVGFYLLPSVVGWPMIIYFLGAAGIALWGQLFLIKKY